MAEGVFTITELINAGDPSNADVGERFEWTSDARPTTAFDGNAGGGAKACPIKPWRIGGMQRNVRTVYPNAKIPSVQVLGPDLKPQTFHGRWDDRYNGSGYAEFEHRRFVAMAERGNMVRVQFGTNAYEGLIEDWDIDWLKAWHINYEFRLGTYNRPDQTDRSRSPETPADAGQLLDQVDLAVQALLDTDRVAPRHAIAGTLADDVTGELVNSVNIREALAATVDERDVRPPEQPVDGFTRIATQFRSARGSALALLERLAPVRADLDLGMMTAMSVLDFEDWTRSLRYMARVVAGTAATGDLSATEHADPEPVRLYRPSAGEHLYAISRKFYGTPHAWQLIYQRNSLQSFTLRGTELLIIPERGGA